MSYKLMYFNGRARAEVSRLIFAQAGVQYEDVRIERGQWAELKPKTPFGQLPVLELEGGVRICQSYAIARYLARKFDLAGKTELEQARADMLIYCMKDATEPAVTVFQADESRKPELLKKFLEEQMPKSLEKLENLLKENNGGDGFFVGDELTWVDINFMNMCDWVSLQFGVDSQFDNYPKLNALRQKVSKLPRIAEWLEKRPKTSF